MWFGDPKYLYRSQPCIVARELFVKLCLPGLLVAAIVDFVVEAELSVRVMSALRSL